MSAPPISKKDGFGVLRHAFDDATGRLRVDAAINVDANEISISAADGDNVAISDGVDTLAINPDGSINTNISGSLDVEISAADGDNIAISDGTNSVDVNPDGSINVNVTSYITGNINNVYNEITSVPSSTLTTIASYTASSNARLQRTVVSGTNIAEYRVLINSLINSKKRTMFGGNLNTEFVFEEGINLASGDTVEVKVIHDRPYTGDFNTNIIILEL